MAMWIVHRSGTDCVRARAYRRPFCTSGQAGSTIGCSCRARHRVMPE